MAACWIAWTVCFLPRRSFTGSFTHETCFDHWLHRFDRAKHAQGDPPSFQPVRGIWLVGAAGLPPTHAAVVAGKTVALANKEAMVLAGQLLSQTAAASGGRIIPIDSEHSALDQCLRSGKSDEVKRLILTASGGPFRNT